MIIKKLKIVSSEGIRVLSFSLKTIINSKKNSVGKSTILRILFYGLGYPIPSTYKLKFKNLKIWITFERDGNTYEAYRYSDYLELKKDGEIFYTDPVAANLTEWYSLIWGIDSLATLENLIGAIYLEQDKGWTLLNRGKVIGNISFNVRDLLIGLSSENKDLISMIDEQNNLRKIHDETKAILKLEEFTRDSNRTNDSDSKVNEEDLKEYKNIKVRKQFLQNKISRLKKYIKRTDNLENYIYSLNLLVKNPENEDHPIVVSKKQNNLINFKDTIDFLRTELISLQLDLNEVEKKEAQLNKKLDQDVNTLFSTEDVVESSLNALGQIKINRDLIEKKQENIEYELESLNKDINTEFNKNKEIIEETENWIKRFAKILGVEDVIKSHTNYLLTHDIKSISGTQYYKVVFSFKMAYIKVIEKYTNVKLPVVLDSPSGREVTQSNIKKVIDILNKYFEDNQIIIASIYDYKLKGKKKIEIKNKIFEDTDLGLLQENTAKDKKLKAE
ncbi:hypothetical protein [Lactobacillus ultunensis]|uniref:Putative ATP synthase F1, delta subunit n=1 Tax=Lactobacillus ultunensis DSM 16047 TaxID=525365 RepID=C2EQH1_9LACO|nr:hypothetical protein [Lactobacillus ultunensis]EEJ71185.1 putative ATP synthase F1, delta subunit [Lactobacillus ultunensis DSM 16047]KRL82278.1 hypothetical protein FC57_GL001974 [Lactobacillus ultunensis DSM 16047]QQP28751.1 hypothetical protein H4B44_01195 [Lactobacillus ultunensis]